MLDRFLDVQNIALVFLTAILGASVTFGLWPGLYASLLSVLAFNFFFLPPVQTFTIADPEKSSRCSSSSSSRSSPAT